MIQAMGKYWWVLLIQGIASFAYGIAAMSWPALTLVVLFSIFGAFSIFYGISGIFRSFSIRKHCRYWWLGMMNGILGVAVGILVFSYPGLTAVLLLYFIAAWALLTGISHIFQALDRSYESMIRSSYAVAGIASIAFAVILYAMRPGRGIIALVWLLGLHAFMLGIVRIFGAFRLRAAGRRLSEG